MLKALLLFIAISTSTAAAEVPESMIGQWQFDSVRTITTYMADVSKAGFSGPEQMDQAALDQQLEETKKAIRARAPEADGQIRLEITTETLTMSNSQQLAGSHNTTRTFSYEIIGGNSGLIVLQLKDESGSELISNIHLVAGGIAVEQTDCDTYPRQCEEQVRRLNEANSSSTNTVAGTREMDVAAMQSGPKLIFFRPLEHKPD